MGAVCRGWVASRQRRLGRRRAIRLAQSRRRVGAGRGLPTRAGLPRARRGPRLAAAAAGRRAASSVVRPRGSDREGSHSTSRRARVASRTTAAEASAGRGRVPRDRATGRRRDRGAARGHRTRPRDGGARRAPARSRPPPDSVAPPRQPRHPVPTESRPRVVPSPRDGVSRIRHPGRRRRQPPPPRRRRRPNGRARGPPLPRARR